MINSEFNQKRHFQIFIGFYLLVAFLGMYFTPLFDEDEGMFAESARKMIETGDFIRVQVNGEIRYDKPALFYWLECLSIKIFGLNAFAVRFPSFVFFLLLLNAVYGFVQKYMSIEKARLAVALTASILQFQILSKAAVTDNLLNFFMAASFFAYFRFLKTNQRKDIICFYIHCGFGFLSKGPVAWAIPALSILAYHLIWREPKQILKALNPIGIGLCLLIPLPWFYLAYQKSGAYLWADFFLKHNLGRFSSTMESHGGHWWYYVPVLFLAFIPFAHCFGALKRKDFLSRTYSLFGLWFLITFLLFSFSKTQLPHYISPAFVSLILFFVMHQNDVGSRWFFFQMLFFSALFIVLPLALQYAAFEIDDLCVAEMLKAVPSVFTKSYYFLQLMVFTLLIWFWVKGKASVYLPLALFVLSVSTFINRYGHLQQGFVKDLGLSLQHADKTVFMQDHYNPSLSFYANQSFPISNVFEQGKWYFIKSSKFDEKQMRLIRSGGGFALVEIR